MIKQFQDLSFEVREDTVDPRVVNEVCARDVYRMRSNPVPGCKTILDIGGHIGVFTVWAAKHYPEAQIMSVEMDKGNYDLLTRNAAGIVTVVPVHAAVVGNRVPKGRLLFREDATWGHFLVYDDQAGSGRVFNPAKAEELDVPTITCDQLVSSLGVDSPDLVKIDAEGAEYDVILGLGDRLAGTRYLCAEIHSWAIPAGGWAEMSDVIHTHFRKVEILGRKPGRPRNQFMVYAYGQ